MSIADARIEVTALEEQAQVAGSAIAGQALLACVLIACAAANGGYFPTSWGWLAIGFGWAAALALARRRTTGIERRELVFLGAFAALTAWIWASTAWSSVGPETQLEGLRVLVPLLAIAAVMLLASRETVHLLPGGVLAATTAISLYALATRLVPDRLGAFDPSAGYRLSTPLGYWNALGIFAALGVVLAVGMAARAPGLASRSLAASSLLVLMPTLYFTYSRGAWLALAIGLAVAIAVDPRRLHLLATVLFVAPASALAVYLASRSPALTAVHPTLAQAAQEGHRLAGELVVLLALAVAAVLLLAFLEERVTISAEAGRDLTLLIAFVAAMAALGAIAANGGPLTIARQAGHAFTSSPAPLQGSLNGRLLSLSGNGRIQLWRTAVSDLEAHPLLGSGAGTYEQYWLQHRPIALKVRDAHNLYLETAAELGLVGLALLLVALATPLLTVGRTRRHPLGPCLAGAYCAFLAHAAADWDWEVPAVTLCALICGTAILVAARSETERLVPSRVRSGGLIALVSLVAVAFVGLVGSLELSRASSAAGRGNWNAVAADAGHAHTWAPFSSTPWQRLGEAEIALGHDAAAQESIRRGLARSPEDWTLWFDLARASTGDAQLAALARARALNPLSPEIREFQRELADEQPMKVVAR